MTYLRFGLSLCLLTLTRASETSDSQCVMENKVRIKCFLVKLQLLCFEDIFRIFFTEKVFRRSTLKVLWFQACLVDGSVLGVYNDTNRVGCQERCRLEQQCGMWTWWGDSDRCQLFRQCQDSNQECSDCLTGNRWLYQKIH